MVFFGVLIGIPLFIWFVWRFGFEGERLPEREPDLIIIVEREESGR